MLLPFRSAHCISPPRLLHSRSLPVATPDRFPLVYPPARTWQEKRAAAQRLLDRQAFDPAVRRWLESSWTGLHSIDLWLGGLAEKPEPFGPYPRAHERE